MKIKQKVTIERSCGREIWELCLLRAYQKILSENILPYFSAVGNKDSHGSVFKKASDV